MTREIVIENMARVGYQTMHEGKWENNIKKSHPEGRLNGNLPV